MHAIVYSQPNCPACVTAKTHLKMSGYTVEERILGVNATKTQLMADFPDARSVPQVIMDGVKVGSVGKVLEALGRTD